MLLPMGTSNGSAICYKGKAGTAVNILLLLIFAKWPECN